VESTRLLNPGDPAVTHERSENMFCWAVATGVSIRLRDLIILEGGYRWISLGDAFFGDPRAWEYEGELYGQDVYMGVRFQF
jgi:opacity protein-like surface antigen